MAIERLPNGAFRSIKAQTWSPVFRKTQAPKEVESHRETFLQTPTLCLGMLAYYVGRTYQRLDTDSRPSTEQPKHKTLLLVLEVVEGWLNEEMPDLATHEEKLAWVNRRIHVVGETLGWCNTKHDHYPNPEKPMQGMTTRTIASELLPKALSAHEKLKQQKFHLHAQAE